MEDKTKQKESHFKLEVRLQKEKLEFKKEQFYLKEKKQTGREGKYKRLLREREDKRKVN